MTNCIGCGYTQLALTDREREMIAGMPHCVAAGVLHAKRASGDNADIHEYVQSGGNSLGSIFDY